MPRTARAIESGLIYHVLNRGNGCMRLFHKDPDFEAFEQVLKGNWLALVNEPLPESDLDQLRTSVNRDRPLTQRINREHIKACHW